MKGNASSRDLSYLLSPLSKATREAGEGAVRKRGARRGRSRRVGMPLLALILVFTAGCSRNPDTYRYELTLNFSVDGKLQSGSSVVEVSPRYEKTIDATADMTQTKGQATVVNLGNGRYVFGLLTGDKDVGLRKVFGGRGFWLATPNGTLLTIYDLGHNMSAIKLQAGSKTLDVRQLPSLVTFRNIRDPSTAAFVDPNDVQRSLGKDVVFVGATLGVVQKPITTGIDQILPWLRGRRGYLDGSQICTDADPCYKGVDFERGV